MVMPLSQQGNCFCLEKSCTLLLALGLTVYLYWRSAHTITTAPHMDPCPLCKCDCPSSFGQGLHNNSADCNKMMDVGMGSGFVDLLMEELKLQAVVADDANRRVASALHGAKKRSLQYQREAEKCALGMEACEEARERAMEKLEAERKLSGIWEQRALELGWKNEDI